MAQVLAGAIETYSMEKRYVRKDGAPVWVNLTVSPVWKADGSPDYSIAVVEDISARRRAEAALRESEGRLRLFIELAPAALAMFDRDMRYLAASQRWLDDYGLGDSAILGRSHYEAFPEIGEDLKAIHRRGLAGEVISGDDYRFERAGGEVQWVRWEMRPWQADDGSVGGIVIFTEDISERKRAAVALADREAQYRAVIETAGDGFWMVDEQGRLLAVNDAYVRRSGYTRAELLTMRIADLEAKESPDETLSHVEKVRREGSDLFETRHRTKSGEIWPAEITAAYWPAVGGRFFVFLRDISERKRTESDSRRCTPSWST